MIQRFHGIDRHKYYSTISVKNREGKETRFIGRCEDLRTYIETLGPNDAVAIESSTGSFHWADQIESRGCICFVLDPFKFKIIRESWNKCDKHDCRNMATALWVHVVTGEFGLPTVYKPDVPTRELRKLFAQYQLLGKQAIELMNNVQAILTDNGVVLNAQTKKRLFNRQQASSIMDSLQVSPAGLVSIRLSLELLWQLQDAKKTLRTEILRAGRPFYDQVKTLITIRGITPFMALAFLADVGDVRRFKTLKKMNAYLGVVQKAKESGGKTRSGGINRQSRKLTRTLLTQALPHIAKASPHLRGFYEELRARRGVGRARIALIRKVCGIMRRMLLDNEVFRSKNEDNFTRKLHEYENALRRIPEPQSA